MGTYKSRRILRVLLLVEVPQSNTEKQKESCVCRISKDFCFLFEILGEIGGLM
jgi:hypothetical protein